MANTSISNLTASASNLATTDVLPVVQTAGVGPVKMTGTQLKAGIIGAGSVSVTSGKTLTINNTLTLDGTDSTTMTFPGVSSSIGYLNVPQGAGGTQTTGYTAVLADSGEMIIMNGSSITFTIPANGSVAYPVGTVLTIININASNLSIAITTDTLTLAGTTTTGTRTLTQNGLATAVKTSSTGWLISGVGLS